MATVQLSWTDNASDEVGFRVYRTTVQNPSFPSNYALIKEITTADTTSYTDENAPTDNAVSYAVTAFTPQIESTPATNSIETPLPITIDGEAVTDITIDGNSV